MGLPADPAAIRSDPDSLSRAGAYGSARHRLRQGPRAAHPRAFRRRLGLGLGRDPVPVLPRRAADRVLRPHRRRRADRPAGPADFGAHRHPAARDGRNPPLSHGGADRDLRRRLRTRVPTRRLARASEPAGGADGLRGDPDFRQQISLSRLRQYRRRHYAVDGVLPAGERGRARPHPRRSRRRPARHRARRRGDPTRHGRRPGRDRRRARPQGRGCVAQHGAGDRRRDHALSRRIRRQAPVRPRHGRRLSGRDHRGDADRRPRGRRSAR